ncbi:MAG: hypothetical protein Q9162_006873 [Coniocarpon cinnabarinum]
MQLGTIKSPDNKSLLIGISILLSIAISPLQLTSLGLLSRLVESINKSTTTLVTAKHIRILQLLNTIGLILSIVGGDISGSNVGDGDPYTVAGETKAGVGLFIATFVGIIGVCLALMPSVNSAEAGERRILMAVAASLPFMLVRIAYSCLSAFGNLRRFSVYGGDENDLIGMALVMELVVVVVYEILGLTLKKLPPAPKKSKEGLAYDTELADGSTRYQAQAAYSPGAGR